MEKKNIIPFVIKNLLGTRRLVHRHTSAYKSHTQALDLYKHKPQLFNFSLFANYPKIIQFAALIDLCIFCDPNDNLFPLFFRCMTLQVYNVRVRYILRGKCDNNLLLRIYKFTIHTNSLVFVI